MEDNDLQCFNNLQGKQKTFLILVTDSQFLRLIKSATEPKPKAQIKRAKWGREERKPAEDRLKPKTSLKNFGVAVIKKNNPHMLP